MIPSAPSRRPAPWARPAPTGSRDRDSLLPRPAPCFAPNAKRGTIEEKDLTIYYTDQCPFIAQRIEKLRAYCATHEIPAAFLHVETTEQAKMLPCPFNNWAVFYGGRFVTVNQLDGAGAQKLLARS